MVHMDFQNAQQLSHEKETRIRINEHSSSDFEA
jgi:hypothetical protein